jgi:hypothetical protein
MRLLTWVLVLLATFAFASWLISCSTTTSVACAHDTHPTQAVCR